MLEQRHLYATESGESTDPMSLAAAGETRGGLHRVPLLPALSRSIFSYKRVLFALQVLSKFPYTKGLTALRVPEGADVRTLVKGQVAVSAFEGASKSASKYSRMLDGTRYASYCLSEL